MYQWADVYRDTLAFLKIGTKEDWMSIPSSGSRKTYETWLKRSASHNIKLLAVASFLYKRNMNT